MDNKIIELITTLGDGGAETLVKDYSILLNRINVETNILTIYRVPQSSNLTQVRQAGIKVRSILPGNSRVFKFFKQTIGFIYIPYRIYKIIKASNATCVHVHMNQLHHIAPIAKFLKNTKIIYTCHNDPSKYFRGISGNMEYRAVKRLVKYDNFLLVALHDTMAKELSLMFNTDRVEIIRNGVDFNKYTHLKKNREEKRKEVGIDKNAYVIGHIGRFSTQKNHSFLVDIFEHIAKKDKNAFLLMVGAGTLEGDIIKKLNSKHLENRYMILSHRTDIPELLNLMDVYLFPSLYEGLPVSLVEAQVSKLHCVVSDTINKVALLLPSTIALSLNDPIEKWSDECLKKFDSIDWNEKLIEYDMNHEIIKLKELVENNYKIEK